MINAALQFKARMKAMLAGESAAKPEPTEVTEAEKPAESKRTTGAISGGDPALAFQRRIREAKTQARLEELRKQDEKARQEAATSELEGFQLLLHQLELDEKRLRELPTGEARDVMVANELMPTWRPLVEAYLDDGEDYTNPILVLVMIWAFNIKDMEFAVRCADVAIDQDQRMPDRFNRNIPTFMADQVLEWATNQALREEDVEPYFSHVFAQLEGFGTDIPDIVHIKYLKFMAKRIEAENPQAALELYEQAFAIEPTKSKCKSALARLRKIVAKQKESDPAEGE